MFSCYFDRTRQSGVRDQSLVGEINATFICLTATVLHHCLQAWSTGEYKIPTDFGGPHTKGVPLAFIAHALANFVVL